MMPRVFLSYSNMELEFAEALEKSFRRQSISAWCDKTDLHVGDKWPKELGEAIQQADALLLIWSAAASRSKFVELEWNIALALKKPVLPILTDYTALPAVLSASHYIKEPEPQHVVECVKAALSTLSSAPTETAAEREAIIAKLDNPSQRDPRAVLRHVKDLMPQSGWTVSGQVYQAGGDIYIQGDSTQKKTLLDRWKVWVGIVVGVLTALMLMKQLVIDSNHEAPVSRILSGIIVDELDNPIQGAKVMLMGSSHWTLSDAGGRFSLQVHGTPKESVRLNITKGGFYPLHEYYPVRQDVNVVLRRE